MGTAVALGEREGIRAKAEAATVFKNILFTLKKFQELTQLVSSYGACYAQGCHMLGHLKW